MANCGYVSFLWGIAHAENRVSPGSFGGKNALLPLSFTSLMSYVEVILQAQFQSLFAGFRVNASFFWKNCSKNHSQLGVAAPHWWGTNGCGVSWCPAPFHESKPRAVGAGQLEHARMMDGSKNSTPKWNTNKKTNDNWSNHQILSDSIWILEDPAALPSGLWSCCWAKKTSTHRRNLSGRGGKKDLGIVRDVLNCKWCKANFAWIYPVRRGTCDSAVPVQCQCSVSTCPFVCTVCSRPSSQKTNHAAGKKWISTWAFLNNIMLHLEYPSVL